MKNRLFASFSGGPSSAVMVKYLKENYKSLGYSEAIFMMANTGQEREEMLEFARQCDLAFGLDLVIVEAVINPKKGAGTRHREVTFETADRTGRASFDPMIQKYGIPNMDMPHCTRELKLAPMTSYLRSIGWKKGTYDTAIGIRVDEIDRMNEKYRDLGIIYPLIHAHMCPMTQEQVNEFWRGMPFRLQSKGYQGNCKWCWKKTLRKHLTLIKENEDDYSFPAEMEERHGHCGALAKKTGEQQVFFRKKMSTADLIALAKQGNFTPAEDHYQVYPDSFIRTKSGDVDLDMSAGCSESCDVFHD